MLPKKINERTVVLFKTKTNNNKSLKSSDKLHMNLGNQLISDILILNFILMAIFQSINNSFSEEDQLVFF